LKKKGKKDNKKKKKNKTTHTHTPDDVASGNLERVTQKWRLRAAHDKTKKKGRRKGESARGCYAPGYHKEKENRRGVPQLETTSPQRSRKKVG